jgi:hypothetical protein
MLLIYILIREGKPLYPFLSKLRARRSVRFGIVKVYVGKECRIYILIREGKPLYPFLSKLRARRSVRFGIVKVYVGKECRKIKFMYNIQGVPKKRNKSIAPLFIGAF